MQTVSIPQQQRPPRAWRSYALAASVRIVGLFFVHEPHAAVPYDVDICEETCTCPEFIGDPARAHCSHLQFVKNSFAIWRSMEPGPAPEDGRCRRFKSAKNGERIKGFICFLVNHNLINIRPIGGVI